MFEEKEEKQYMVAMEWARCEDSIFTDSHIDWFYAKNSEEAEEKAKSEYGHHQLFEIKSCW